MHRGSTNLVGDPREWGIYRAYRSDIYLAVAEAQSGHSRRTLAIDNGMVGDVHVSLTPNGRAWRKSSVSVGFVFEPLIFNGNYGRRSVVSEEYNSPDSLIIV